MPRSSARRTPPRTLQVETLESRHTMATTITASLSQLGVMKIEGTPGNDQIVVSQILNKITVTGVGGAFDATRIKSIEINTLGGNDTVKLSGISAQWNKPIMVTNGSGSDVVTSIGGKSSTLTAGIFTRTSTGQTTVKTTTQTTAPTSSTSSPTPTTTTSGSWVDVNIRDAALRSLLRTDLADRVIDRREMLDLFAQVAKDRIVTTDEYADLTKIASTTAHFTTVQHVGALTANVVLGDAANATYQGTTLGNLRGNVSAVHLEKLVNKWFLGLDRPATTYNGTTYAYAKASGTLFSSSGPLYTDVRQGVVGDCYFVGALGEAALRSPSAIRNMFINNGDGTYTVRFFNNGKAEYVTVDSQLPVDRFGRFVFANMGGYSGSTNNVLWVALAEKAYAQMNQSGWLRTGLAGDGVNAYHAIASGYFSTATLQITNRESTTDAIYDSTFSEFKTAFDSGKLIGFATTADPKASNLVSGHQYVALNYNTASQTVTMYNPWGMNNGTAYPGTVTFAWSALAGNFSYWDRA